MGSFSAIPGLQYLGTTTLQDIVRSRPYYPRLNPHPVQPRPVRPPEDPTLAISDLYNLHLEAT